MSEKHIYVSSSFGEVLITFLYIQFKSLFQVML